MADSKQTTAHDEIRRWVEERGGRPPNAHLLSYASLSRPQSWIPNGGLATAPRSTWDSGVSPCGRGSAFDGTGGEAGGDVLLDGHEEDHHG